MEVIACPKYEIRNLMQRYRLQKKSVRNVSKKAASNKCRRISDTENALFFKKLLNR